MKLIEFERIERAIKRGFKPVVKLKNGNYAGSCVPAIKTNTWSAIRVGVYLNNKTCWYNYDKVDVIDYIGKATLDIKLSPAIIAKRAAIAARKELIRKTAKPKDMLLEIVKIGDTIFIGANLYEVVDIDSDYCVQGREMLIDSEPDRPMVHRIYTAYCLKLNKEMLDSLMMKKLSGEWENIVARWRTGGMLE